MSDSLTKIFTRFRTAQYDPSKLTITRIPELKMWEMVIYRAVWDYLHFWEGGADSLIKRNLARQAQVWVMQNPKKPRMGDFIWCCEECYPDFSNHAIQCIRKELSPTLPPVKALIPDHVRIQKYRQMKRYPC